MHGRSMGVQWVGSCHPPSSPTPSIVVEVRPLRPLIPPHPPTPSLVIDVRPLYRCVVVLQLHLSPQALLVWPELVGYGLTLCEVSRG